MSPQERCEGCIHNCKCFNIIWRAPEGLPDECPCFHGTCEMCKDRPTCIHDDIDLPKLRYCSRWEAAK